MKILLIIALSTVIILSLVGCAVSSAEIPPQSNAVVEGSGESGAVAEDGADESLYLLTLIKSDVNSLCVRKYADATSAVVGYLDKGDSVVYKGKKGTFFETVYKESTAYVSSSYSHVYTLDCQSEKGKAAITFGASLLGYPYVYGSQRYHWGNGVLNTDFVNGKFDCSSLVQYIFYKTYRINLGMTTRTQVYDGKEIKYGEIKCGDLLFFTNSSRYNNVGIERVGHVAIYIGENLILHTASDHAVIEEISPLRRSYFITARRVL